MTEWSEIFSNLLMTISSFIPIMRPAQRDRTFKDNGPVMFTAEKVRRNNRFDDGTDERRHLPFS
jgi:hypothetical protein